MKKQTEIDKIQDDFAKAQTVLYDGIDRAIRAFNRLGRHMANRIAAHKAHTTMAKNKGTASLAKPAKDAKMARRVYRDHPDYRS
jgi:hypothetical protein